MYRFFNKKLSATLISLLFSMGCNAQLTLQQCKQWARDNYPEVKRYDMIESTRQYNLSNASRSMLPAVTVSAEGGYVSASNDLYDILDIDGSGATYEIRKRILETMKEYFDIKEGTHFNYKGVVNVVQPIYDGGASNLRRKAANAESAIEESKIEVSLYALDEKVEELFFSILLLEKRERQLLARMKVVDANYDKLKALQSQDVVRDIDILAFETEKLSLEQSHETLKGNILSYRTVLEVLTDHEIGNNQLIEPEKPSNTTNTFALRPELRLIENQKSLIKLAEEKDRVALRPKIGLMGMAYYGYPNMNIIGDLISHQPKINAAVGLKIQWDLSPLYSKKNNKGLMQNNLEFLDIQRQLLERQTRVQNTTINAQIEQLEKVSRIDNQILERRRKLRTASEVMLQNGTIDSAELLRKISDEADAELLKDVHATEILMNIYKLQHNGQP